MWHSCERLRRAAIFAQIRAFFLFETAFSSIALFPHISMRSAVCPAPFIAQRNSPSEQWTAWLRCTLCTGSCRFQPERKVAREPVAPCRSANEEDSSRQNAIQLEAPYHPYLQGLVSVDLSTMRSEIRTFLRKLKAHRHLLGNWNSENQVNSDHYHTIHTLP